MFLEIKVFFFSLVFNILIFHIDFRISGVQTEVMTAIIMTAMIKINRNFKNVYIFNMKVTDM